MHAICTVWVLSHDDAVWALAAESLQGREFIVHFFDDPQEASRRLALRPPDVVLSGPLDEERDGAFSMLRGHRALRIVPWMIVAAGPEDALLDVMEDAADDFVLASDGLSLPTRVRAVCRLVRRLREAARPAPRVAVDRGAAAWMV